MRRNSILRERPQCPHCKANQSGDLTQAHGFVNEQGEAKCEACGRTFFWWRYKAYLTSKRTS